MRETLRTYSGDRFEPYLVNGVITRDAYKETIQSIHTDVVNRVLERRPPNRVLGATLRR